MVSHEIKRFTSSHISQTIGTMKQITLRVPDDMAQMIEEWAERIPEMEVIKKNSLLYHD